MRRRPYIVAEKPAAIAPMDTTRPVMVASCSFGVFELGQEQRQDRRQRLVGEARHEPHPQRRGEAGDRQMAPRVMRQAAFLATSAARSARCSRAPRRSIRAVSVRAGRRRASSRRRWRWYWNGPGWLAAEHRAAGRSPSRSIWILRGQGCPPAGARRPTAVSARARRWRRPHRAWPSNQMAGKAQRAAWHPSLKQWTARQGAKR